MELERQSVFFFLEIKLYQKDPFILFFFFLWIKNVFVVPQK